MKTTKITASGDVGMWRASRVPRPVPMTMPGSKRRSTAQLTAPWRSCARRLDSDVKITVAIAVPSATCSMCSRGKPCAANAIVVSGTWMPPPPIPSMPAKKPMNAPIATYTSSHWSTRVSLEVVSRRVSIGELRPPGTQKRCPGLPGLCLGLLVAHGTGRGATPTRPGSARRSTVRARRPSGDPLENVGQMRGVGETQARGDGFELLVGVRQQVLGDRHANSREIVADAHPDLRAEEMGEVARGDVGDRGDTVDGQVLVVVAAQVVDGAAHRFAGARPRAAEAVTRREHRTDPVHQIFEPDRRPQNAADIQALPDRRGPQIDVVAHDEHRT